MSHIAGQELIFFVMHLLDTLIFENQNKIEYKTSALTLVLSAFVKSFSTHFQKRKKELSTGFINFN